MYLAHLEKLTRTRLEDVLVQEGVVDRPRVEDAQAEQEKTGRQLGDILIEREIVSDYDLAKLVATHYGLPYLDVGNFSTRREVVDLLPADYCVRHAILPLDQFGSTLTLAITEMPGQDVIDHIVDQTKLTPFFFVAVRRALLEVLETEKKRGPSRTAKARPTPVPAASASPARPVAARPAAAAVVAPMPMPRPPADLPLPDLDLPVVSMKLVGGAAPGAARTPPAPARPPTQVVPAAARATPADAKSGAPGGGLGWMDSAAGARPQTAVTPPRPRMTKFPFSTSSIAGKTGTGARDTSVSARPQPPAAPAKTPTPAKTSVGPAKTSVGPARTSVAPAPRPQGGSGWQSIFDVGEEEVRRTKAP